MPTQIEKVNRYYEASALDYHTLWTGRNDLAIHFGYYMPETRSHSQSLLAMNRVLASSAHISASDRVLDAGCGYGGSSLWLAENIGCTTAGISVVPFQLARANHEASRRGLSAKCSFSYGDYANTPFADASFSVFWTLESVVHAEDKAAVAREAFRLLQTGGRLIMAEYALRDAPPLSQEERECLQPWLDGWAMPVFPTPAEYRAILAEAGFSDIEVNPITSHVIPSLNRLRRMSRLALPGAQLLGALGIFSKERVGNVRGSVQQMRSLDRGLWDYSIISAVKN